MGKAGNTEVGYTIPDFRVGAGAGDSGHGGVRRAEGTSTGRNNFWGNSIDQATALTVKQKS